MLVCTDATLLPCLQRGTNSSHQWGIEFSHSNFAGISIWKNQVCPEKKLVPPGKNLVKNSLFPLAKSSEGAFYAVPINIFYQETCTSSHLSSPCWAQGPLCPNPPHPTCLRSARSATCNQNFPANSHTSFVQDTQDFPLWRFSPHSEARILQQGKNSEWEENSPTLMNAAQHKTLP